MTRNVLFLFRMPTTGGLLLALSVYPLPAGRVAVLWLFGRCWFWRLA